MIDIMERLIALANALRGAEEEVMLREAAAEIERLFIMAEMRGQEIERLRAKIERWEAQSIAQYAEIERLRKELTWFARERDSLRAALTEAQDLLSDGPGGPRRISAMEVIRRALEDKP